MSLFGFADINFNKQSGPVGGPLRALEGDPNFGGSTLRYPIDIGNYDKGHYVVFYVREQKKSKYAQNAGISDDVINALSAGKTFENIPLVNNAVSNFGSSLLSKLNSGLSQLNSATGGALSGVTSAIGGAAGGLVGSINNIFGQKPSIVSGDAASTQSIINNNIKQISQQRFINTTQLTRDAIALYMPDTLSFTYSQNYEQLSLGEELGGQLAAAGRTAVQEYLNKGATDAAASLLKAGATAAIKKGVSGVVGSLAGQSTGQVAAYLASGVVTNPMLEMLYKSPNFRTFQFDFMFYPRDEKEALEVQRIIDKLRFHQAPEYAQESVGFLIPPSEFDIRFYYGGFQNPNIPQIATCVMTSIDVNYAPNGWTAYEVPGESKPQLGRTGMPVAIQVTLQFQEVEMLTKESLSDGNPGSTAQQFSTSVPVVTNSPGGKTTFFG